MEKAATRRSSTDTLFQPIAIVLTDRSGPRYFQRVNVHGEAASHADNYSRHHAFSFAGELEIAIALKAENVGHYIAWERVA